MNLASQVKQLLVMLCEGLGEERLGIHLLDLCVANTSDRSLVVAQMALVGTTVSNLGIHNLQTDELSVAEEVAAGAINGFAILGPGELRNGVSTDGSGDPQLHALIH